MRATHTKPAAMRRFIVTLEVEIAIPAHVIDSARAGDRCYEFTSPNSVAEHLAFNLVQGRPLSSLDGFADLPDGAVKHGAPDPVECIEIKPKPEKDGR